MLHGGDLIDPVEMALRVLLECEEEQVPPQGARITERLGRSAPTVSRAVDRMERQGLLRVGPARRLLLSALGRRRAVAVLRKHRLAEVLLTQELGVPWAQAHDEADRMQHVLSERAETLIFRRLGGPTHSPYGNRIPGLEVLGGPALDRRSTRGETRLARAGGAVELAWIGEWAQSDATLLHDLHAAGIGAGQPLEVIREADRVVVRAHGPAVRVPDRLAGGLFVRHRRAPAPLPVPG
jgi:DtxR family transcriptional regulator, Mn-dependent transcriptional regulator